MKNLRSLIFGLGILTALSSCASTSKEAQAMAVGGKAVAATANNPYVALAGLAVSELGYMEHDMYVAEAGKDQVNVYGPQQTQQGQQLQGQFQHLPIIQSGPHEGMIKIGENAYVPGPGKVWNITRDREVRYYLEEMDLHLNAQEYREHQDLLNEIMPRGFFAYTHWVDLNKDDFPDREELFGFGKPFFNLDEEHLRVYFFHPQFNTYEGNIILRSFTPEGKLVGESIFYLEKFYYLRNFTGLDADPSHGDYLDKMREHGPGDYILTATDDFGKTFKINISFTD